MGSPELRRGWTLCCVLLLLACGGGGGGGSGGGGEAASATSALSSFNVSGTVVASQSAAADGDTNNLIAPASANDTVGTAQEIPNPVSLTGYVNVATSGPPGRSFGAGDPLDLYRVALGAGQTVSLFISGDGAADDLDLALYNSAGDTLIVFSATATPFESVVVPASDDYLIAITAFQGAANYTLVLAQNAATAYVPAPSPKFVPGELIVVMRDRAGIARSSETEGSAPADNLMAAANMQLAAGEARREMLLRTGDVTEREASFEALGMAHLLPCDLDSREEEHEMQAAWDTVRLAKGLASRSDVMAVDLNFVREASLVPDDPLFASQWHFPQINLPQAWEEVPAASGVVVAVLDTGVVSNHPDLQNMLVPGYDFISNPGVALDGTGIDPDPEDPGDQGPGGSSFHGTHVAGTIAAETGNTAGVAGVAWNASIMPVRVLGFGGGTDYDLIQGIRYAAALANDSGTTPAQPADVINMSLGGPGFSQCLQAAVSEARNAGVIVVAASGNSATSTPFYPAALGGVTSVSAVTLTAALAPYSNFGGAVDVAAPGGDFRTDLNGDGAPDGVLSSLASDASGSLELGYGYLQGTSMAAPHVSGIAALMLSVNPGLTPADFDNLLVSGSVTQDLGAVGRDDFFGHGLIDAYQAVVAAANLDPNAPPPVANPSLVVTPSALNFGIATDSASLSASNGGGGALVITGVSAATDDGQAWLAVVPGNVDAAGQGTYEVSVDRNQIPANGIYTGTVTVSTVGASDFQVPVIVQVGSALSSSGDAGFHYVLLIDAATRRVVDTQTMAAQTGAYPFSFGDVPGGSYQLYAGTDSDNDGFICDPGESCGAYPIQGLASNFTVDSDRSGLNFVTGSMSGISSSSSVSETPWTGIELLP